MHSLRDHVRWLVQVRYGMDDSGVSPQWVLNGLRFMKFGHLRPILDMLLQLAPIRFLILQVHLRAVSHC